MKTQQLAKPAPGFFWSVCGIAVPVALQSMLQSSFAMVDQVMIGQLGSAGVAGVGTAGKFSYILSVVVSAIGAVAGIMISQYIGQKNEREVERSFLINLTAAMGIAAIFTLVCMCFSRNILGLYTSDNRIIETGAEYLTITAAAFLPSAGAALGSVMLRCMEKAALPLYASILSAVLNTLLNYILIFGKIGIKPMGVSGAATATVISQWVNMAMIVMMLYCNRYRGQEKYRKRKEYGERAVFQWKQYGAILFPLLICEFMWSLGENSYAAVYGHLGLASSAAMILNNPVQGMVTGALCGLSQAAGVMIGKRLGKGQSEEAYEESKRLMLYGLAGSLILSALVAFGRLFYVEIYQVEEEVKVLAAKSLMVYAVLAPVKVENMILGGGILRSGGKTKYIMAIDLAGTWVFGVPLALISGFVLDFPVYWVYFILSMEECVRLGISLLLFRKRKWMHQFTTFVDSPITNST